MMHSLQSYTASPASVPNGTFLPIYSNPTENNRRHVHFNLEHDTSSYAPHHTSSYTPHHTSFYTPHHTSSYTPHDTSSYVSPHTSSYTPHHTSSYTPHHTSSYVSPHTSSYVSPAILSCDHGFGRPDNTVKCNCNKHILGVPFPKPLPPIVSNPTPNPYVYTNSMSQGFFFSPLRVVGISTFCG